MNHNQASLSITNSWSLPKFMSIELMMPSIINVGTDFSPTSKTLQMDNSFGKS